MNPKILCLSTTKFKKLQIIQKYHIRKRKPGNNNRKIKPKGEGTEGIGI